MEFSTLCFYFDYLPDLSFEINCLFTGSSTRVWLAGPRCTRWCVTRGWPSSLSRGATSSLTTSTRGLLSIRLHLGIIHNPWFYTFFVLDKFFFSKKYVQSADQNDFQFLKGITNSLQFTVYSLLPTFSWSVVLMSGARQGEVWWRGPALPWTSAWHGILRERPRHHLQQAARHGWVPGRPPWWWTRASVWLQDTDRHRRHRDRRRQRQDPRDVLRPLPLLLRGGRHGITVEEVRQKGQ